MQFCVIKSFSKKLKANEAPSLFTTYRTCMAWYKFYLQYST